MSLGEITDVELFCRDALARGRRQLGVIHLEEHVELDALSFLIERLYELWGRYDPLLNTSFTKYAYPILPLRLVDWYRQEFGDTRYRPRPRPSSLDEYHAELARVVDHGTSMDSDNALTRAMWPRRLKEGGQVAAA